MSQISASLGLTEASGDIIKITSLMLFIPVLLYFYDQLLKKLITDIPIRKLIFASGVFVFFSAILLAEPFSWLESKSILNAVTVKIIVQCCWWLALNLLINQLLEYCIWNKLLLNKGIIISKIFKDFVSVALFIIIIAAILHFVFLRSAIGLFTASGVMAIILGYSAQAILSDIFAGLGLNTSKQFNKGDWIQFNDGSILRPPGMVVDINWRFVNLLTLENNYFSVPNSVISRLQIINLSQPEPIHGVTLKVSRYDDMPPEQFKNILRTAANQSSKVARTPAPTATLSCIKQSEYQYELFYFTKHMNEAVINDELLSIIWYQCQRRKIQDRLSPEQIRTFLKQSEIFHELNKEESASLAEHALVHHYGPPERILEFGQKNSSLFIIYEGTVDRYDSKEIEDTDYIDTLYAKDYFGDLSLLTGDVCNLSVIAKTEVTVIEITHESIQHLFENKPELINLLSDIVVSKKTKNKSKNRVQTQKNEAKQHNMIDSMVEKIRLLFKNK